MYLGELSNRCIDCGKDIYQDIKVVIAALAESLGVAAGYVYRVLVKQ